jgi:hypothetical protein
MDPFTIAVGAISAIGASILTYVTTVLSEGRAERRRKGAKLEEAYQSWLDNEAILRSRFKRLSWTVARRCETPEDLEGFRAEFETGRTELMALTSAMNKAHIYETDAVKKKMIEVQLSFFHTMMDTLNSVLEFYRLVFSSRIESELTQKVLAKYDSVLGKEVVHAHPLVRAMLVANRAEAQASIDRISGITNGCMQGVKASSNDLLQRVNTVESNADEFRRILVS